MCGCVCVCVYIYIYILLQLTSTIARLTAESTTETLHWLACSLRHDWRQLGHTAAPIICSRIIYTRCSQKLYHSKVNTFEVNSNFTLKPFFISCQNDLLICLCQLNLSCVTNF